MNKESTVKFKKGDIEKRIWGHRLYDEQTGMMTLLEFLCVLENRPFSQQVPDPSLPIDKQNVRLGRYKAFERPLLRSLIFNNPYIDEVYTNVADPWECWCDHFIADEQNRQIDGNGGSLNELKSRLHDLKAYFNEKGRLSDRKSFDCFARVIRLIRYSGINLQSGKRWTSRFVFPWGRHCLYLDMDIKGETNDRRFFARNGELLYMMLCFADKRDELAEILKCRLYDSGNDLDTLCRLLSLDEDKPHDVGNSTGDGCILPVEFFEQSRKRINILCEDLITLFKLPIPTPDIVKHVSRLLSLNLLCYFLEQSYAVIGRFSPDSNPLPCIMPCEILTKGSSDVRRVSRAFFERHQTVSFDAVRLYHEHYVGQEPTDSTEEEEEENSSKKKDRDSLKDILNNHKHHWGSSLFRALAKDCGLASDIYARSFRYAPSDNLIETLAAVIVPVERKRMLLPEFLKHASERYNIVFGEKEFIAANISDKTLVPNSSDLEANRFRLQAKFRSLGLLVALSDGFEFVLNPYQV